MLPAEGKILMEASMKLIEPTPIPDIFVSGLSHIEMVSDGNVRFVCYARRLSSCRTKTVCVVAARIVWPVEALDDGIAKTINARPAANGAQATRFYMSRLH